MTHEQEQIKLILIIKYGSMFNVYVEWMNYFEEAGFTQMESDTIEAYAKETNRSLGIHHYDYR